MKGVTLEKEGKDGGTPGVPLTLTVRKERRGQQGGVAAFRWLHFFLLIRRGISCVSSAHGPARIVSAKITLPKLSLLWF